MKIQVEEEFICILRQFANVHLMQLDRIHYAVLKENIKNRSVNETIVMMKRSFQELESLIEKVEKNNENNGKM